MTGGVLCTPGQPPDELVPIAAWEQVPALARAHGNVALGHPAPPRRLRLLHRGEQGQPGRVTEVGSRSRRRGWDAQRGRNK